jgi:transcriptional regulator with XRE-family HTH domain
MKHIGKRITELRTKKGYSQKTLAKMTGITEASLSRYENDLREPKISTLVKLSTTLDCTVDYLIGKSTISDGVIVSKQNIAVSDVIDKDCIDLFLEMKRTDIQTTSVKRILEAIQIEKGLA